MEGEEHASGGAFLGLQRQQVLALELHRAGRDFIAFATGQDVAQRGLAGAVRAHDRVHLSGLHIKREAFEDFLAGNRCVEVFDFQHCCVFR